MPAEIKARLSNGDLDTANFMEQFALDIDALIAQRLPEVAAAGAIGHLTLKRGLVLAGQRLLSELPVDGVLERVRGEPDTVRAIAALGIGVQDVDPAERLRLLKPFADDPHFAVREWAWIGLRESLGEGLLSLVPDLAAWAEDASDRVRRFSCEILRPRGVWCRHLPALQRHPSLALPVLDRLSADSSRYVQLSVGNWLNDAARSQPGWVADLCGRWQQVEDGQVPALIIRRGLRNLDARHA